MVGMVDENSAVIRLEGTNKKRIGWRMKKRRWLPVVVYLLCLVGAGVVWWACSHNLPQKVATHFDISGRADGWMSGSEFLRSFGLFGLLLPLLVPAIMGILRILPERWLNIPQKDYWMRPENRGEIGRFLFPASFWIAAANVLFVAGLFYLTVEANRQSPPVLNGFGMAVLTGGFLLAVLGWVVYVVRFFIKGYLRS